jgi:hypothetical protein
MIGLQFLIYIYWLIFNKLHINLTISYFFLLFVFLYTNNVINNIYVNISGLIVFYDKNIRNDNIYNFYEHIILIIILLLLNIYICFLIIFNIIK